MCISLVLGLLVCCALCAMLMISQYVMPSQHRWTVGSCNSSVSTCAEDIARAALLTIHQHFVIESAKMTQFN